MSYKRLDAHLSNLGYCTRGEAKSFLNSFVVCINQKREFNPATKANHVDITIDGELLDPEKLLILMHKPAGVVCSHNDSGVLIYSLLPHRWQRRTPKLATIGRLDADTTGAILITDDGELNHQLSSPKKNIPKTYQVWLEKELIGNESEIFASGTLMLHGESKPLLPAKLSIINSQFVELEITEGKYHQVKRMFAALGNKVTKLHRKSFKNYFIDDLAPSQYKLIDFHLQ